MSEFDRGVGQGAGFGCGCLLFVVGLAAAGLVLLDAARRGTRMTYTLHPFGESWEIRLGERSVAQVYARSDATAIVDWFNSVEECDACMTFQPKDEMSNSNSYICTDARICDGCRDRARSA